MTFVKGQSGNPGGRPKELAEVQKLARKYTAKAIKRLAHWLESDDARASVAAAQALMDRGWGKATQPLSGPNEGPLEVDHLPGLTDQDRAKAIMTLLGKK